MSREADLYKDKIEVSLDGRQIFYLFFGGAVIVGLVFVLGVMVGRRVEARGHVDRARTTAAVDPLAALDRLEDKGGLSFKGALMGGNGTTRPDDVEHAIGVIEKQRKGEGLVKSDKGHDKAGEDDKAAKVEGKGAEAAADKVTDKAAAKATDKPSDKVADKASDKVADKASDKVADKASDKVADKASDKAAGDKSSDKAAGDKSTDKAAGDKSTDKAAVKATDKSLDKATDKAKSDKPTADKLAADKSTTGDKSTGDKSTSDKSGDKSADKSVDKPVTKPSDKSLDKSVDKVATSDKPKTDEKKSEAKYTLQLSSFQDRAEADAFLSTLKAQGFAAHIIEASVTGKGTWYRVRMGSYRSIDAANDAKAEFEKKAQKSASVMKL